MWFKREVVKQFIRFCLVGLENTILNYLVFLIMFYFLSVNYLIASGSGFVSGVLLGFIFNKLYSFNSNKKIRICLPKYFLVNLFSLVLTLVSLKFFVSYIGLYPVLANLIILPVTTLINFFGAKIFAFENKEW